MKPGFFIMDFRVVIILILEAFMAVWLLKSEGALKNHTGLLIAVLLIIGAFLIRFSLLDYETTDYQWFLTKWIEYYRQNGGFSALNTSIGNYNIPYLYFLSLFSYSSVRDLYLIKLLSIFFDVILAYSCFKLVKNAGGSVIKAEIAFFAVLFLPTVILNGAKWGQCDSMYASMAILAVATAIGGNEKNTKRERFRPILSMILIAISFGFKLQAVFIMPIFIVIWVWKKYKWYDFLVFPVTYFLLILPSVILGRPIKDAIMLYIDQANTVGSAMNYNSPSITALMKTVEDEASVSTLCIILAFAAMLVIIFTGIRKRKYLNGQSFSALTALMVLAIPFFLPHMHDRYFFLGDTISVSFACLFMPSDKNAILEKADMILRITAAALIQFGSLICYLAYFTGYYMRLGNIFLTNNRGAVAVVIAMFIYIFSFSINLKNDEKTA